MALLLERVQLEIGLQSACPTVRIWGSHIFRHHRLPGQLQADSKITPSYFLFFLLNISSSVNITSIDIPKTRPLHREKAELKLILSKELIGSVPSYLQ